MERTGFAAEKVHISIKLKNNSERSFEICY